MGSERISAVFGHLKSDARTTRSQRYRDRLGRSRSRRFRAVLAAGWSAGLPAGSVTFVFGACEHRMGNAVTGGILDLPKLKPGPRLRQGCMGWLVCPGSGSDAPWHGKPEKHQARRQSLPIHRLCPVATLRLPCARPRTAVIHLGPNRAAPVGRRFDSVLGGRGSSGRILRLLRGRDRTGPPHPSVAAHVGSAAACWY